MGGAALVSCGPAENSEDSKASTQPVAGDAVAMRVKGEQPLVFQQGYSLLSDELGLDKAFDDVVIELLDADKNVVKEVPMLGSTAFTHGEIDTSALVEGASFDLTYTEGNLTLRLAVPYRVIVAQLSSWSANREYARFLRTSDSVSEEKNIQTAAGDARPFMKKTKFYVGNYNAMSLFPAVSVAEEDVVTAAVDTLDATRVSVKLLDSSSKELQLSSYMSEEAINDLITHGLVNFNDDVEGSFKIVFQYANGAAPKLFPDLTYDIEVVDGYNINKPEDAFVLSNDDVDDSGWSEGSNDNDARIAAWKSAHGIPAFEEKYHTGIIQRDITFTKDNIPDYYIWSVERDHCNSLLEGSFRDYSFLLKRTFLPSYKKENLQFNLYGNYHNVQFSADFPRIAKMGYEDGEPEGKMVESHSSLIGVFADDKAEGYEDGAFPKQCKTLIRDIHGLGNHGIEDDQELKTSGMLFLKSYVDTSITNNFLNKWYTTAVLCNRIDAGPENQIVITVDSSRFDDTYNASIFNWHNCRIDIINSEITNAGGPLIFNQAYLASLSEIGPEFTSVADNSFSKVHTAIINIDEKTYLENWTMGRGGWFSLYNAEAAVGTLKAVNQAVFYYTGYQSSFLDNGFTAPTETDKGRFNFLVLNMPAGNSLVPERGAVLCKTIIGNKVYVSYDDGRVETLTKFQNNDFSAFWSTHFGARAFLDKMFGQSSNSLLFSTLNDEGNPVFMAPVDEAFTLKSLQYIIMGGLKDVAGFTDEQIDAVADIDPAFATADYLAISLLGSCQGFLDDMANPFASYVGSNSMTMLLTLEHPA